MEHALIELQAMFAQHRLEFIEKAPLSMMLSLVPDVAGRRFDS